MVCLCLSNTMPCLLMCTHCSLARGRLQREGEGGYYCCCRCFRCMCCCSPDVEVHAKLLLERPLGLQQATATAVGQSEESGARGGGLLMASTELLLRPAFASPPAPPWWLSARARLPAGGYKLRGVVKEGELQAMGTAFTQQRATTPIDKPHNPRDLDEGPRKRCEKHLVVSHMRLDRSLPASRTVSGGRATGRCDGCDGWADGRLRWGVCVGGCGGEGTLGSENG